jgi:tetrahydromethanopterin S-methyltransferase subunit G
MEETVTESKSEDQSQPATNGTVRILAVRADAGFTQLQTSLGHLNEKIDHVDDKLCQRIDGVESRLGQRIDNLGTRIDGVESNLGQRIDNVEKRIDSIESNLSQKIDNVESKLGQQISNLSQQMNNTSSEHKVAMEKQSSEVKEKLAERAKSDKFLMLGFAIALLSIFAQMAVTLFG